MTECPGYCRTKVFLYPEHLHMTGRYNSLFALDQTVLRAPETDSVGNAAFGKAEQEVQPDRAVLNLL